MLEKNISQEFRLKILGEKIKYFIVKKKQNC